MRTILTCAAALAALVMAGNAAAASKPKPAADSTAPANPDPNAATPPAASSATPPASTATPPASTATTPPAGASTGASTDANATATAPLTVGMPVKDNTGAEIGTVSELKPDPSGTQMATIQMGADKFAVSSSSIAVQNGAGVINLTKADLQAKLHPSH